MRPAAVRLEQLLLRDRRPFAKALAIVTREYPDVTARGLEETAAAFTERAPRADHSRPTTRSARAADGSINN